MRRTNVKRFKTYVIVFVNECVYYFFLLYLVFIESGRLSEIGPLFKQKQLRVHEKHQIAEGTQICRNSSQLSLYEGLIIPELLDMVI